MNSYDRFLKWFSWIVLFAFAAQVVIVAIKPNHFQWDFRSYYAAAKAYRSGLNPYDKENFVQVLEPREDHPFLPFLYSPPALWLLLPFTFLPYTAAFLAFLALKIGALLALIWVWRQEIFEYSPWSVMLILSLLAFNMCIAAEMRAGNIALFEALGIWASFHAYRNGRKELYAFLIVVVSLFKVVPALLLGWLAIRSEDRKRALPFGILLGAAIFAAAYAWDPILMAHYLEQFPPLLKERGNINPTFYTFLSDIFSYTSLESSFLFHAIFILFCLIAVSGLCWRIFQTSQQDAALFCLFCATLALILPRFKNYSYILLIPVIYVAMQHISSPYRRFLLGLLAILPFQIVGRYVFHMQDLEVPSSIFGIIWDYAALWTLGIAWGILLFSSKKISSA